MSAPTLHYIFDPLCGWCYAAAPLMHAVQDAALLPIVLHGGGMLTGDHRRPVTAEFRRFVMGHDQRIQQMTGQPFGAAYTDGLLLDTGVVLDSTPPTIALLAAEALAGLGLPMLAALQQAHYVAGRQISQRGVLDDLARALGLDEQDFQRQWDKEAAAVEGHFADSHRWLAMAGGQGFPTLALARGAQLQRVDLGPWLGRPAAFVEALRTALAA